MAHVLGARLVQVLRREGDGCATVAAKWGDPPTGSAAEAPIIAHGEPWGLIRVGAVPGAPLPADAESGLA